MQSITRSIRNHKDLYRIALVLGITGYGGLAILDKIHKAYVKETNIVSETTFLEALSLSQVLPGSTIINLVAFFSYMRAGLIGAFLSTAIYIFPTFIVTTLLSMAYFKYANLISLSVILFSLNVLLIPLLINAVIGLGHSVFFRQDKIAYRSVLISVVSLSLFLTNSIAIPVLILISGLLGGLFYSFHGFVEETQKELEIVDEVFFKRKKAWILVLLSMLIFAIAIYTISKPLWMLFLSFLKVGMLSFGGGVAALPLMESLFVSNLGWLTQNQFWDGVAISQLTPGPILIVSAFIGFQKAGITGAGISTIGMVIPSVLLIILAGKIHKRIRHLAVIQNVTQGFLCGFIGILTCLIMNQAVRIGISVPVIFISLVSLLLIRKFRYGIFLAAILCFSYSFLFNV